MNTTHIGNSAETCLLKVLFEYPEKQGYIFENTEKAFFQENVNAVIYETAKQIFDKQGNVTNLDVYEKNKTLNMPLINILAASDTVAYASLTSYYCKKLYERRLKQLIADAKSEEELTAVKEFKQKYATLELKVKHISDNAENFEEKYTCRKTNAIKTCYSAIDNIVGSFLGGDYIVLGAGTGMGKTTIALNIANMLSSQEKKVLYFSLEMTLEQLQNRFVCLINNLDCQKFRNIGFTKEELEQYKSGLKGLKGWNLDVVCDYNLTPEKMRMYIENQKRKGLDFVILDYLGLMSGYENKSGYEKITNISRQIKLIATEFEVPILVLVQLNRDLKNRNNKRPLLSDIRESGAIEQDADFVMFAYRDYAYNPYANPNELEIFVAKNRHGKNNVTAKLDINLSTQLISEKWGYNALLSRV